MNFNLKKPCKDCPFLIGRMFPLNRERREEIAEFITTHQGTFPCHKTTEFDDDSELVNSDKTEHCAGAAIMLEKMKQPNQMMRWMERIGEYDYTKLAMDSDVFDSADEFIDAAT